MIERAIDDAEILKGLRETATAKGIDWSQLKALVTAQAKDARDEGDRVGKLVEKADFACAYAEMLSGNMNENGESRSSSEPEPESGAAGTSSLPTTGESEPVVTQACSRAGASSVVSIAPAFRSYTDAELEIPDYLRRA